MDNELFLKRLEELAEITKVKATQVALRQTNQDGTVWRSGQEIAIDNKNNPTLTVAVKKLKHMVKDCEDCGESVVNRTVHIGLYAFPEKHWRKNCVNCRMTHNPDTGKFDIPFKQAQAVFTSKLRDRDK